MEEREIMDEIIEIKERLEKVEKHIETCNAHENEEMMERLEKVEKHIETCNAHEKTEEHADKHKKAHHKH